ncbi:MAG TPA: hypothetical protein VGR57_11400 [Ktedonobacterales bacterium]|nr:hypothetical protein [Ktedonobacterales bacterium]
MNHVARGILGVVTGILTLLLLAGCAGQGGSAATQNGGNGNNGNNGGQFVTLRDPTADQLRVQVGVVMGGYDAQSRDTTRISVDFISNNSPAHIVGTATLTCNGQALSMTRPLNDQQVQAPTATLAGQVYRCVYQVGTSATEFSFTLPQAPRILSPQDGASVPRGAAVTVIYQQGGQVALLPVDAHGNHGTCSVTATQATCDTRSLAAGPGSIRLTESVTPGAASAPIPTAATSGPAFQTVSIGYTVLTAVLVTWA